MSLPEEDPELAEAIQKDENPSEEDRTRMWEDEERVSKLLKKARAGESEKTPVRPFECRFCACNNYKVITVCVEGRDYIIGYACTRCSNLFYEVEKFSNI